MVVVVVVLLESEKEDGGGVAPGPCWEQQHKPWHRWAPESAWRSARSLTQRLEEDKEGEGGE